MRKLILPALLFICSLSVRADVVVKSDDTHIHYMGRIGKADNASVLSWPGTSASINFNGTSVTATLEDQYGENYYNVIVDGQVTKVLHLSNIKKTYILADGLPPGKHQLTLFKRTEWVFGKTIFYQFAIADGGELLPAPATKSYKIEYFGDSITCGYAVEDSSGRDRGIGQFENNYLSYAAIVARHYNAEYNCIARSGIGLTLSYYHQIMPEMYHLTDGSDTQSEWDFNKFTPDVVVINLFQNDAGLLYRTDLPEFKARFGDEAPTPEKIIKAYQDFIKQLRSKYPQASIICTLGSMDAVRTGSSWPDYVKKAAAGLADKKVFACIYSYKNTPGHPNIAQQQAMASQLIAFIDKHAPLTGK